MVLGGILPIIIPLYLIFRGKILKNIRKETLGWIIGQAAIIGSLISSFYKIFTGRIQPIFWGWPSSHTTVAYAMAFALINMFPKNKIIKFFSILYALYISVGVSFSIHWFSDCIAGAIIGTIIGIVVAKSYKNSLETI